MKPVVVFLIGMTATLTGAFIRSCQAIPGELLQSWCGAPPQQLIAMTHQHCAGCVLIATGIGLMVLSPLLGSWSSAPVRGRISR